MNIVLIFYQSCQKIIVYLCCNFAINGKHIWKWKQLVNLWTRMPLTWYAFPPTIVCQFPFRYFCIDYWRLAVPCSRIPLQCTTIRIYTSFFSRQLYKWNTRITILQICSTIQLSSNIWFTSAFYKVRSWWYWKVIRNSCCSWKATPH